MHQHYIKIHQDARENSNELESCDLCSTYHVDSIIMVIHVAQQDEYATTK
jgi:hypothetical protein